jgi:hypothetical protein
MEGCFVVGTDFTKLIRLTRDAHSRCNPPVRKPLVSVQVQKGSVATNSTDATERKV